MSPETAFAPASFATATATATATALATTTIAAAATDTDSSAAFAPAEFPSFGTTTTRRFDDGARARGHAAGYLAGMREAAEESARAEAERRAAADARADADATRVARAVQALDAAILALHARTAPVLDEMQTAIGVAAVDIAEALIGTQLCDAAESARAAMTRALTGVDAATVVEVRMNAADLVALPVAERVSGVTFVADPELGPGDAITRFPDGFLDARIATAVSRVRAAIAGEAR